MSHIARTLRNIRKAGVKDAWHQLQYIGDTKAGTLVGVDKFGNKYFENMQDELPLRTRWVDYKKHDFDAAQAEPHWHAWLAYGLDVPPPQDPISAQTSTQARPWASPQHIPNLTQTRGAFKPYSTTKPKISAWEPKAAPRA